MNLVRMKNNVGNDYQNIFIDYDEFVPKPVEDAMNTVSKNFPNDVMEQVLNLMDEYDNRIISADESGKKSFLFHKTTPLKDNYHISIFFKLYGYIPTANPLTFVPVTYMTRNKNTGKLQIRVPGEKDPIGFINEDKKTNCPDSSYMAFFSNGTQYTLCLEIIGIGKHIGNSHSNAKYELWVYNNNFFKGGVCDLDKL